MKMFGTSEHSTHDPIAVSITAFDRETPIVDRHPAFQLKCPVFTYFELKIVL